MNNNSSSKKTGSDLRIGNMSLLLRDIRENGPMSRADLARDTGLTRSTVSNLTQDLIKWQLLQEVGYRDVVVAGKKATLLDIRINKIFILSVKLSNSCVDIAKVNLRGQISECGQYVLNVGNAKIVVSRLKELIRKCIGEMELKREFCYGIGIAVPSPVRNGRMAFSLAFQCLENMNLEEVFGNIFGRPVCVSNNADAAALGEIWFAQPEEKERLAFILIDQGIGCGIVFGKESYYHPQLYSNEFGHMIVKEGGPRCFCGNHGCLTSFASDWAVCKLIERNFSNQIKGTLAGTGRRSREEWFSYILENIEEFEEYIKQAANYLGIAVANLIDILMPDTVVIGGNLVQVPGFIGWVNETCLEHVHPFFKDIINIRGIRLDEDAVLVGASAFLLRDLYSNPSLILREINS